MNRFIVKRRGLSASFHKLVIAALNFDFETVAEAVKEGAYVDACDNWERTALMLDCWNGDCRTSEFLIENGADINIHSAGARSAYTTPLISATGSGHANLVEFLLNKRYIEINAEASGGTALNYAIMYDYSDVGRNLKSHGGKVMKLPLRLEKTEEL